MTGQTYYHCLLGAIGWDHAAWVGPFYPDDMPQEWRLSYYNTHFECVYLPYASWARAPTAQIERWREDTLERFRFLLEPPESPDPDDDARLALLGEKAILAHPRQGPAIVWLEPEADLRALARALQDQAAHGVTFYLVSVSADLGQLEQARTLLDVLGY